MSEFDVNGVDALPGVPLIDVIDETGRVVHTGYYVRHINRTPCAIGDCLRPEDVEHLVVVDEFSDYNMPRGFKAMQIIPPHTIKIHNTPSRYIKRWRRKVSDRMKLYISGQISGRPYGEAQLVFGTAAQTLAGLGFEVFNPMQDDHLDMSRAELMKDDIRELLECDGVALLPGWQKSSGARVEKAVADECGIVVAEYERWVELPYRKADGNER